MNQEIKDEIIKEIEAFVDDEFSYKMVVKACERSNYQFDDAIELLLDGEISSDIEENILSNNMKNLHLNSSLLSQMTHWDHKANLYDVQSYNLYSSNEWIEMFHFDTLSPDDIAKERLQTSQYLSHIPLKRRKLQQQIKSTDNKSSDNKSSSSSSTVKEQEQIETTTTTRSIIINPNKAKDNQIMNILIMNLNNEVIRYEKFIKLVEYCPLECKFYDADEYTFQHLIHGVILIVNGNTTQWNFNARQKNMLQMFSSIGLHSFILCIDHMSICKWSKNRCNKISKYIYNSVLRFYGIKLLKVIPIDSTSSFTNIYYNEMIAIPKVLALWYDVVHQHVSQVIKQFMYQPYYTTIIPDQLYMSLQFIQSYEIDIEMELIPI